MTDGPTDGDAEPLDRDELRHVEARLDARLQEMQARLVIHDGRFAAMHDRLNHTSRQAETFTARLDPRLQAIDRRFDALDSRLDSREVQLSDTRDQFTDLMQNHRTALWKTTILGLTATSLTAALIIGATIWLTT